MRKMRTQIALQLLNEQKMISVVPVRGPSILQRDFAATLTCQYGRSVSSVFTHLKVFSRSVNLEIAELDFMKYGLCSGRSTVLLHF